MLGSAVLYSYTDGSPHLKIWTLALISHTYKCLYAGQDGQIETAQFPSWPQHQPEEIRSYDHEHRYTSSHQRHLFTESFVYLGSIITPDDGSKMDIQNRMNKARSAFISMKNIWKSSQYSMSISCVVPVLLYGAEPQENTQGILAKQDL